MSTIVREFVSLESPTMRRAGAGGAPCQGLYHVPQGARSDVAVIATHYNVDFSEHYLAGELARRGIGFLGWNTRYRGNEAYFLLEQALVDIGVGVRWLREVAGVSTVVLLGNSGGGSLMAAFQAQATDPAPGTALPGEVEDLPCGDLYISLNAHPGRPEVLTAWLDPSVTVETDPLSRDPAVDMYDPANGPPYDQEFLGRYRAAQRERNDRITAWVKAELARLAEAGFRDRLFDVHRVWADPRFVDLTIDPSEREPGCYAGDPMRANYGPLGIGRTNTLRSWLSMWSLSDSACRAEPKLRRLDVPALVVQSTADQGVFPSDGHAIFEALGSSDKELHEPKGAHYFEAPPGARQHVAELLAGWIERQAEGR